MISQEKRQRLDAAVSAIRHVYNYVDQQIQECPGSIAGQIYHTLRQNGCSCTQARRQTADYIMCQTPIMENNCTEFALPLMN